MNAELLLAYFNRISEAPDAVPRLRRFILDLAVRGKLVQQNPNDEPASELLKRIRLQKARLVREGIIKKLDSRELPVAAPVPSPIPSGWAPSILQSLCISVTDGDHLPPPKAEEGVPFLVIGNVRNRSLNFMGCRYVPEQYYDALDAIRRPVNGDILYTLVGSYGIPVLITDDRKFCVQRHIGILRPSTEINPQFLRRALESEWVFDQATACATGIAQKTVPLSGLRQISIPLPPLAEQNRIVAKVDELMALCERLDTAKAEREDLRKMLAAAAHHHLNNGGTVETFRKHARFYLNHFPRITNFPEQIKQLRQTILNLAVRGRLVSQDRNDEPAASFLGDRHIVRDSETGPWELPSGWAWSSFDLIGETLGGGTPSKANPEFWDGAIPWVSPKDMKVDEIKDAQDHISISAIEQSSTRLIPKGSLLMVVRGMILAHSFPTAITAVSVTINQDMKAILPFRADLIRFLLLLTKGLKPEVLRLVLRSTHGTCKLLTDDLFSLPIPIPPLAEQCRIVAKVSELMALCDRLEEQLSSTQAESRQLLEAVLAEASSVRELPGSSR